MKEQFATYEIALAVKELDFNEPCFAYYVNDAFNFKIYLNKDANYNYDFTVGNLVAAPLWQQVIDWFYEKHNIEITYGFTVNYKNSPYMFDICKFNRDLNGREIGYDGGFGCQKLNFTSKEEAREAAILKAIELCQRK